MFSRFKKLTIKDFRKKRYDFDDYYKKYKEIPTYLYINDKIHKFDRTVKKERETYKDTEIETHLVYKNIKDGYEFGWMWKSESKKMKWIKVLKDDGSGDVKNFEPLEESYYDYVMKNGKLPTYVRDDESMEFYKFYANGGCGFHTWKDTGTYKNIDTDREMELMWKGQDRLFDDEIIPLVKKEK